MIMRTITVLARRQLRRLGNTKLTHSPVALAPFRNWLPFS